MPDAQPDRIQPAAAPPCSLFLGLAWLLIAVGCSSPTPPATSPNPLGFGKHDVTAVVDTGLADAATVTDAAGGVDAAPAADLADQVAIAPCPAIAKRCAEAGREVCAAGLWTPKACPAALPLCLGGDCLACKPGALSCAPPAAGSSQSSQLLLCDADGLDVTAGATCGGLCLDGKCVACEPGSHRCRLGERETCAADGKSWTTANCPPGKPMCVEGACYVCPPGKAYCAEPEGTAKTSPYVLKCDADGGDSDLVETCKAPKTCHDGGCKLCIPGHAQCPGAKDGAAAIEVCNPSGQAWVASPCPAAKPVCAGGVCRVCVPDALVCGPAQPDGLPGSKVLKCDGTGTKATLVETCKAGLVCGSGQCTTCVAGSQQCVGSAVLACNATGDAWAFQTDCAANALSCKAGACSCAAGEAGCAPAAVGLPAGQALAMCAPDGKSATITELCKPGGVCQDGSFGAAAACLACAPGSALCLEGKPPICKADGSGWQLGATCADQGETCVAGVCVDLCKPEFANPTNLGCEFWAVDLDNALISTSGKVFDAQNAPYGVLLVNPLAKAAAVTVSLAGKTHKVQVGAKAMVSLPLPPAAWALPPQNQDGTAVSLSAYRIESDHPLAVFQHNPLQGAAAFSGDGSLLLPSNALGNEHRVLTRAQVHPALRGFLTVVATRPGKTTVTIRPTAKTLASSPEAKVSGGAVVPALEAGGVWSTSLEQGQVLNVETDAIGADLSGSQVSADQPVAVFAGAEATLSPNTNKCVLASGAVSGTCKGKTKQCFADGDCPETCCTDHLEEQLLPLTAWGTAHVVTRLQPRGKEKDAIRVVAAYDGTIVTTLPPQDNVGTVGKVTVLGKGQWLELESAADFAIVSSKPVQVAQYMASSQMTELGTGATGDPMQVVLPPVDRASTRHVFALPAFYPSHFLNVAAPLGALLTLDGSALPQGQAIGNTGWTALRHPLGAGVHVLEATRPVIAIVYGLGKDISYGHATALGAK